MILATATDKAAAAFLLSSLSEKPLAPFIAKAQAASLELLANLFPIQDAPSTDAKPIPILALQVEAGVMLDVATSGKTYADAAAYADAKVRLLVAAQEQGRAITPALAAEIDHLAQSYAKAGSEAEKAGKQMEGASADSQKMDADMKTGANAIGDLFMSATEGSESFANALRNLAKELMGNVIKNLILGFAKSGAPGSGFVGMLGGALGGFAEGGFTGPGTKYQPAGIVHAGEFVFSKETVQRIGADNLNAMHSAAKRGATGYAGGGLVGGTAKLSRASGDSPRASGSQTQNINLAPTINFTAAGGTPEQNADLAKQVSAQTEAAMRNLVRDEMVRQQRPGGMMRR